MAISDNLFRSILAMDSYNRGDDVYRPNIRISETGLIGNATLLDIALPSNSSDYSFFAQAYVWNGVKIISYRGTDAPLDVVTGWVTGGGSYRGPQAQLAAAFYKSVIGAADPFTANVEFTGHSLGGGLAGFMASLYAKKAVVFDNMPFQLAALSAYEASKQNPWVDVPATILNALSPWIALLDPLDVYDPQVLARYYFNGSSPTIPDWSQITAFATSGEILAALRGGQTIVPTVFDTGAPFGLTSETLGPIQRHSQALLTVLMYGDTEVSAKQSINDWKKAIGNISLALFDNAIAQAAGADGVAGRYKDNGDFASILATAIAYSAIDEGTRVFGDAGIRALYNDANDLGKVLGLTDASKTIKDAAPGLAKILTQFAGQLAIGKVTQAQHAEALSGVLSLSGDQQTLAVDFSDQLWALGSASGGSTSNIIGRDDLIKQVLSTYQGGPGGQGFGSDIQSGMKWLWNADDTSVIDRFVMATKNNAINSTLTSRPIPSSHVALFAASEADDLITGSKDNEFIFGGDGKDTLRGGLGDDLLAGGAGDDRLSGGAGKNFLAGGAGEDTVFFDFGGVQLSAAEADDPTSGLKLLELTNTNGAVDRATGVEKIELTVSDDRLNIADNINKLSDRVAFDGGDQSHEDVLDFSSFQSGVSLKHDGNTITLSQGTFSDLIFKPVVTFKNFEKLVLSAKDDTVDIAGGIKTIETEDGNDTVSVTGPGIYVNLGAGDDKLKANGPGTIVKTGDGADRIEISHNGQLLIEDASTIDRLTAYNIALTGGVKWGVESIYAYDGSFTIRYGRNAGGDLIIKDWNDNETFIPKFNFSTNANLADRTAGLYVVQISFEVRRGDMWTAGFLSAVSILNALDKIGAALLGLPLNNKHDPLVLDLNGNGFNFSALAGSGASFDIDKDKFAEPVGWVRDGDGILARDLNANGIIDDVGEVFGNAATPGFSQLRTLDGNNDGKVSALDDGLADFNGDGVINASDKFSSLKVWVDANEDGKADAGELKALSDFNIESISVASTATSIDNSGNVIAATGTFRRSDGTIGAVAEVQLDTDNTHTRWLGDTSVSAAAAMRPDLKGFGTLADLHVAMTLKPTLVSTVDAALPSFNTLSLSALRDAFRPIMSGWASAVPVPAGTPGTEQTSDFRFVGTISRAGTVVYDFLISKSDGQGVYFGYASGQAVYDAQHNLIARPTQAQVLNSVPAQGTWNTLLATDISFLERYTGYRIGFGLSTNPSGDAIKRVSDAVTASSNELNRLAVRMAAQGPLKTFFAGISYDATSDLFLPTTNRQLAPMLEAIFAAAPTTPTATQEFIANWKDVINVMLPDLRRDDTARPVTDAYLFQNLVSAYENIPLSISLLSASSLFDIPVSSIKLGSGSVVGTTGSDIFYLDSSDQSLTGLGGADSYVVGKNFGHDVIQDVNETLGENLEDSIWFSALNLSDLTFARDGLDLLISQKATSNQIRVVDEFAGRRPGLFTAYQDFDKTIEIIKFSDGSTWDKRDIALAVGAPSFSTNDTLIGTPDADVLNGGAGTDYMSGGDGGDHYMFGRGDGHDTISDRQSWIWMEVPDYVNFGPQITQDDLMFKRDGSSDDLQIQIKGTDDVLTIAGQFGVAYGLFNSMTNRIENFTFTDGSYINWEDVIKTMDALAGTDGNDIIYGFSYEDVLDGGKGDDYLSGGNENDTYVFGRGYGHDVIQDHLTFILSGNIDTVRLKDIVLSDVTLSRVADSNDLIIRINGTNDELTVRGQFAVNYGLIATMDGRIENFVFSDGTMLHWDDIIRQFDATAGTNGNDTIYGFSFADILAGGKGDDTLDGGRENDTYIYNRGDGNDVIIEGADAQASAFDTLVLHGINPASVSLVRSSNDLTLIIAESASGAGDGGSVRLKEELDDFFNRGVEQIVFDNGTVWTQTYLRQRLLTEATTPGNDVIVGFNVNDILVGGRGDDVLKGDAGDDTYVYTRGDGNDTIIESAGGNFSTIDTLILHGIAPSDISLARNGSDVKLVVAPSSQGAVDGGSILLKEDLQDFFSSGVEKILFDNGTSWTQNDLRLMLLTQASTSGNDIIVGFNTNDVLIGGHGDDILTGDAGDDTYIYTRGDGNDTIIESAGGNFSTIDTLNLIGIAPNTVSFIRNGTDLTLVFAPTAPGASDGGSVLLKEELNDFFSSGVEKITFSDGTIWTQNDLRLKVLAQAATAGNDVISGFNTNDTLSGGLGNDTLIGGAGDDTYVYSRGDGNDTIIEGTGGNFSTIDTLVIHGIAPAAVTFTRSGADFKMNFAESTPGAGDGGSIVLTSELVKYFSQGVERVVFDDGTVWTQDYLIANGPSLSIFTFARGIGQVTADAGTTLVQAGPGITANDIILQGNSYGDLFISLRGTTDSVKISNDLVTRDWGVSSTVPGIRLDDGSFIPLGKPAADQGEPLKFTWLGNGNNYNLTGSNFGSNAFEITAGSGSITFGNNSRGGSGANTIKYSKNTGFADVQTNNGSGIIAFGTGVLLPDIYLQANSYGDLSVKLRDDTTDGIFVHNALSNASGTVKSAITQLTFGGGATIDLTQPLTFTWLGNANNYNLTGSGFGANVYEVIAGSGSINFANSGNSSNLIKFARNSGIAEVQANNAKGTISLGAGISQQDVYLQGNSYGSLFVRIRGDANDAINIGSGLSQINGVSKSAIDKLIFTDGSQLDLTQSLTFTWLGNANSYNLTGTVFGANVYELTSGSGNITFANSANSSNLIKFSKNAGVAEVQANSAKGAISFGAGISLQDVYLQGNSYGSLFVKIRGDAIDAINVGSGLSQINGVASSAIDKIKFADGSQMDLTLPLTFTWMGSANNYNLTGTGFGANVYEVTAGSGNITFANSSNSSNLIKFSRNAGIAEVQANSAKGTISFGAGILQQDVYLQGNGYGSLFVRIRGDATDAINIGSGLSQINGVAKSAIDKLNFTDGSQLDLTQSLTFTWMGNANNFNLTGTNYGANIFEITAGSGSVTFGNSGSGGSGTNTVKYSRGTGRLDVTLNGGTGTIEMGSGVASGDLVVQSNSYGDLIISIAGDSTDSIIVHSDYTTVNGVQTSGVSQIRFADGGSISPLAFDFVAPTANSIGATGPGITSGNGALGVGQTVTLTVNFSESVVVNTTNGIPSLLLNDGGIATYASGSGTGALTFIYTVAVGQSTPDLAVTGLSLNNGTIKDTAGNALVESGVYGNPAGTLLIDGSVPTVASVTTSPSSGSVGVGSAIVLTVSFSESVNVNTTGGTPTLTLNDGGVATYTGGSGTSTLTFSHTVGVGQSAADLAVTGFSLNGGAIADAAGNNAVLSGGVTNPSGVLLVDGIAPAVGSVTATGSGITAGSGILNAGKIVTLTLNFSENVTVDATGGTPSLALSGGGVAAYSGGTGTNALSFTYTVAAGQNTPDLAIAAVNLNGGTIRDAAGNAAVTAGGITNPPGTLQIDTSASTIDSIVTSGAGIAAGSGILNAGKVVTLTVNFNENVIVNTAGGTPSLTLNDGGTATYTGGSGTGTLTFSHTVAAGQNTPDLSVTSLNLNGGTIKDTAGNVATLTGAVTNPSGTLQIDTTAASIGSVATSGPGVTNGSGIVGIGKVITLTVNFSENVAVNTAGGTPSLTLNNGGSASYSGGSGSGALAFSYTVAAGQNTSDLAVSALNLNGATITDAAGNTAVVAGAAVNPAGTLVVDGTTPTVNSVATSPASGTVIVGNVVTFTVTFSENVVVGTAGGIPNLALNDGGVATYTGGSGSTTLTFSHTVASGQSAADLAVTSLNLNGGTIADQAGNYAALGGAAVNPTGTLVVDGVVPSISSVATSGSGITAGAGVLNAGKVVAFTVNFSENVAVVTTGGTPTLTLNDGGVATYASGSGTSALVFNHTVAAGQNTPDLTVTSLNLNGGTIKDVNGNAANAAGAVVNPAGVLEIDTTSSTVTSLGTSGPGITSGSGTLGVGKTVTLTVGFSENVTVVTTGGTPTLALNNGGVATYTAGTGTNALTFSYTTAAGQSTTDLAVSALNLNGGTIKDAAGNAAVVTGATANPAGVLAIDGTVPSVSSVTTSPASGTVIMGGVVTLTVNFSESVIVNTTGGTPTLALNDGGIATYSGGSGTTTLTFSHTVAAGQSTTDLAVTVLNLNGGVIADAAANNAVVTGAVVNPTGTLVIDGVAPAVSAVATSGTGITSGSGALGAGKAVTFTVTFSESVNVVTTGGTPTLTLNDGGTATYASGSGTTALVFNHTTAVGQNTPDLAVTSLNFNGGTIKDANGNVANVAGAAVNPAGTLKIDTAGSVVTAVATSGTGITAGSGVLNAGKVVSLTVTFDEAVTVTTTGGTPTLTLNDGGTATYVSGTGTNALVFNHTVAAGQNAADLAVSALNLNGGTIKDAIGNAAVLTGAAVNPAGTLQIDTASSTVSSVTTAGAGITAGAGSLNAGKVVTFTVTFNEAVVVTTTSGTPTLTLNDGGVATYNGGSGTSALTFGYTVTAGQNTADLTVTAFNLNSGVIKDIAGNAAVTTGAVVNPAGTLQIDTTASTVGSVATSGPGITSGNGTLGVGAVVTLTVNFNEAVAVTTTGGTPTLSLNDGGVATYSGGTGSSALTFSYTVAAGQNTPDLTVTAFNLNGGTVKDIAGNTAVVTGAVVNPAGTLKISTPAGFAAASRTSAANDSSNRIYTLAASDNKTITPDYSSGTNEFDFSDDLTDENLWFEKSGSSLQIDIMGTKNHITLSDWFNPSNQAKELITAGGLKLDGQVSQLVQAMASYAGSHPGFDPAAVGSIPNDSALQNTIAASWHASARSLS